MRAVDLSVIAIVVSVVSAVFTGLTAVATRRLHRIERARRRDERRPRFVSEVRRSPAGADGRLTVMLTSDEPLSALTVAIDRVHVRAQGAYFLGDPVDAGPGAVQSKTALSCSLLFGKGRSLQPGATLTWKVKLEDYHANPLRLELACRVSDGTAWKGIPVSAEVYG